MIPLKSVKEIEIMKKGGKKLARIFKQLEIKPGISLKEIDSLAEKMIDEQRAKPSFKMVEGYYWATCLNVNQGVVHGVPTDYQLKKGDLLSLDIGLFYQGFHTDMARTVRVGEKRDKFLKTGEKALKAAIKATKPGNHVGHLSQAIEKAIKSQGYQPIKALVGHGVGKKLHEPPPIPCYLKGKPGKTEVLKPGMTLAIEVIYTQGKPGVMIRENGWTVETKDGKLAALFEDSVAVTEKEPLVLTRA